MREFCQTFGGAEDHGLHDVFWDIHFNQRADLFGLDS